MCATRNRKGAEEQKREEERRGRTISEQSEEKDEENEIKTKFTLNTNYLEIPVALSYKIIPTNDLQINVDGGLYLAYGLFGKAKMGDYKIDAFGKDDVSSSGGEEKISSDGLKRFDMGLLWGAGVTYKKFYLNLQYELGPSNIVPDKYIETETYSGTTNSREVSTTGLKAKNRNFSVIVGVKF